MVGKLFLMEIPDQVFKILCELDCFSLGRNYYFLSNTFLKKNISPDMWDKKKKKDKCKKKKSHWYRHNNPAVLNILTKENKLNISYQKEEKNQHVLLYNNLSSLAFRGTKSGAKR